MMNSKERITELKGNKEDLNDQVILDFYNQATGRLLTALEVSYSIISTSVFLG